MSVPNDHQQHDNEVLFGGDTLDRHLGAIEPRHDPALFAGDLANVFVHGVHLGLDGDHIAFNGLHVAHAGKVVDDGTDGLPLIGGLLKARLYLGVQGINLTAQGQDCAHEVVGSDVLVRHSIVSNNSIKNKPLRSLNNRKCRTSPNDLPEYAGSRTKLGPATTQLTAVGCKDSIFSLKNCIGGVNKPFSVLSQLKISKTARLANRPDQHLSAQKSSTGMLPHDHCL